MEYLNYYLGERNLIYRTPLDNLNFELFQSEKHFRLEDDYMTAPSVLQIEKALVKKRPLTPGEIVKNFKNVEGNHKS